MDKKLVVMVVWAMMLAVMVSGGGGKGGGESEKTKEELDEKRTEQIPRRGANWSKTRQTGNCRSPSASTVPAAESDWEEEDRRPISSRKHKQEIKGGRQLFFRKRISGEENKLDVDVTKKRQNDIERGQTLYTHHDGVEVHAVHVQPLDLLQVGELGLRGEDAPQPHVGGLDLLLHLLRLRGHEPELGHVPGRVAGRVVVSQLS
jgi:hypothetical protein